MLKRILASLAIVSLLLAVVLLVYWWRSNHGHTDSLFTLGKGTQTESVFTTRTGRVQLEVTDRFQNLITSRMQFYPFQNVIAYCLIIPGLWLAVTIRRLLPRGPGRERKLQD